MTKILLNVSKDAPSYVLVAVGKKLENRSVFSYWKIFLSSLNITACYIRLKIQHERLKNCCNLAIFVKF